MWRSLHDDRQGREHHGTPPAIRFGAVAARQSVPFNNGIPVAPRGLVVPPLPEEPMRYATAQGQDIVVTVIVRGLRRGEMPGTGGIERILFNENMEELRRESLLVDLRHRIRDVRMGADELLYALTDGDDGAVLQIAPAQ